MPARVNSVAGMSARKSGVEHWLIVADTRERDALIAGLRMWNDDPQA